LIVSSTLSFPGELVCDFKKKDVLELLDQPLELLDSLMNHICFQISY
jgi:hypothetical protein